MPTETITIEISLDGDQWCALLGENLQVGVAGFGDSPIDALEALVGQLRIEPWNTSSFTLG